MQLSSGPQRIAISIGEPRQMATADFRLCGHVSIGPSGVLAQSNIRTSSAISDDPSHASDSASDARARLLMRTTISGHLLPENARFGGLPTGPSVDATETGPRQNGERPTTRLRAG